MTKSIQAYSKQERVARYDADMDLMHPNRHKMVEIIMDVLPFPEDAPVRALELGIGTGFFADRFLSIYSRGQVLGLDGSAAMLELAGSRLQNRLTGVKLVEADLAKTTLADVPDDSIDVVFSAYTLHHLEPSAKLSLLSAAVKKLRPGGWLMNADLVSCPCPEIFSVILNQLAGGILARNGGRDPRFPDLDSVLHHIQNLQSDEHDQPLTMEADLDILQEAGITRPFLFWKEHIEAVYGGLKVS